MIRALARVVDAGPEALVLDVPGWPGHRPGQFVMLTLDPAGVRVDPLLPRPMAIYRGSGTQLELRFKIVGRGTRLMAALVPGATVGVVGPLGNGFPAPRGRALLVGGGTGIASLYELAASVGPTSGARVLLGGRSAAEILGLADFEALGVALEIATEDGSLGKRALVTELLAPVPGDEVFACGPTPMMRRCAELAAAAGVPCRVSLESHMACGFGICLGCAVPAFARGPEDPAFARGPEDRCYRYVCTHGPVFDAAELRWEGIP